MDCPEIEAAILRGAAPAGPGLDEHLTGCASCRFLVDDGAPVAQALAGSAATPAPGIDLDALAARTEATLARERGPLAALRALSRPVRFAAVSAVMAVVVGLTVYLYHVRGDWGVYPPVRLALMICSLVALALILTWRALRPLYLPPRPTRALLAAGVAAPIVMALLPELPTVIPLPGTFAHYAVKCFIMGAVQALIVLVAARALARDATSAFATAAAAAGLAGVLGLALHCPINDPAHLLAGHATVPAALILGYLVARRCVPTRS